MPESFIWLQNIPSQCALSFTIDCKSIPSYVNMYQTQLLSQWHTSASTSTCNSESSQNVALTMVHQTFSLTVYKKHTHAHIYKTTHVTKLCEKVYNSLARLEETKCLPERIMFLPNMKPPKFWPYGIILRPTH